MTMIMMRTQVFLTLFLCWSSLQQPAVGQQEQQDNNIFNNTNNNTNNTTNNNNNNNTCTTPEKVEECEMQHRSCHSVVSSSDGMAATTETTTTTTTTTTTEEVCGSCLDGFIEWNSTTSRSTSSSSFVCFNISDITLNDFLESYKPIYKDGFKQPEEDRLALLLDAIQFIQDYYRNSESTSSSETSQTQPAAFQLGITPFSADDPSEYEQRAGYFYINLTSTDEAYFDRAPTPVIAKADLPKKVDWVRYGAVTSVKDQGRCGCCWATAITGTLEGAAYIQNDGYFQSLSFQQYISCNERNLGCDGGNLIVAMGYTLLNRFGGVSRLNDYPFTDYRGKMTEECSLENSGDGGEESSSPQPELAVTIARPRIAFDTFPIGSFDLRLQEVKQILAEQPIAMVMKSSCRLFSNYRSGVLTDDGDCACNDPSCADHAILMVGYDDTAEIPYFTMKNSWGTKWGEDGYFRVAQTEKGPYGLFGIFSHGVIPGQVTNVTTQVEEVPQDTPLEIWAILLIAVGALVGCVCILEICASVKSTKLEEHSALPAS